MTTKRAKIKQVRRRASATSHVVARAQHKIRKASSISSYGRNRSRRVAKRTHSLSTSSRRTSKTTKLQRAVSQHTRLVHAAVRTTTKAIVKHSPAVAIRHRKQKSLRDITGRHVHRHTTGHLKHLKHKGGPRHSHTYHFGHVSYIRRHSAAYRAFIARHLRKSGSKYRTIKGVTSQPRARTPK